MINITKSMKMLKEKNFSIAEISEKTGISKSTLHDLENGTTSNPRIETIDKICKGLNISVDEFLYGNQYGKLLSISREIMKLDDISRDYIITSIIATTDAVKKRKFAS